MSKLLKISVNPNLIDKIPPRDKNLLSRGFISDEVSLELFRDAIDVGLAFSYQFENEHRKADNFICTDFIALDMDGGREIDDVLNDQIVQKYGSIFYTTPSHTLDHHRFRIIFALPRTLTNVEDLKSATYSLALRLGGDLKIADGARMFYGSNDSNPKILGNCLSEDYLNELIQDGKVRPEQQRKSSKNNITTNRSKMIIDPEKMVETTKGDWIAFKDISEKTTVHCPFHKDENASSFVAFNAKHNMYHFCSKCCKTRWLDKDINFFNFNSFEEKVVSLNNTTTKSLSKAKKKIGLEELFPDQPSTEIEVEHVTVQNEKYIKIDKIYNGLTFVKSPKGSGKTEFLKNYVSSYVNKYQSIEEYEEDTDEEDKPLYHKDRKVLLIGHRQALIGELCDRIGLHSYLNDKDYSNQEVIKKKDRYGVCLDSLWKVEHVEYDLIIIDEVEQVLSHFLSDTIGPKRFKIYGILSRLIQQSNKLIVLDADISWVSFNTLTAIVQDNPQSNISKSVYIHINTHKSDNSVIKTFRTNGHIIEEIKRKVLEGKRIFISSNSKKLVKTLDEELRKLENLHNLKIPRLLVTSENSKSKQVQSFILNIKSEILKYQVILSSPSLGTGIDITFENEEKHIDSVFGIYQAQINNHFDIDQQLSRVRHPKEINVYVSPQIFNFETELGVVEQDAQKQYLDEISNSGFKITNNKLDLNISSFVKMCSRIVSVSRYSMNKLKMNFISLKEYQGYKIEAVEHDPHLSVQGDRSYRKSSQGLSKREKAKLLKVKPFNLYDFVRYEDWINHFQQPVNPQLQLRYSRTKLEIFYQEPVTGKLIDEDKSGLFRSQINRFKSITNKRVLKIHEKTIKKDEEQNILMKSVKNYQTGSLFLSELLNSTPLFDGETFLTDVSVCSDQLFEFINLSTKLSDIVFTQLGIQTRKDIENKPTQHLGKLLKLIGLEICNSKNQKINGKKIYHYQLNPKKLDRILEITSRHKTSSTDTEMDERYGSGWLYMNDLYKFEYPKEKLDWLCPGYDQFGERNYRNKSSGCEKWAVRIGLGDN